MTWQLYCLHSGGEGLGPMPTQMTVCKAVASTRIHPLVRRWKMGRMTPGQGVDLRHRGSRRGERGVSSTQMVVLMVQVVAQ